jgi:hypothetical protein
MSKALALFDCAGDDPSELSFARGDVLESGECPLRPMVRCPCGAHETHAPSRNPIQSRRATTPAGSWAPSHGQASEACSPGTMWSSCQTLSPHEGRQWEARPQLHGTSSRPVERRLLRRQRVARVDTLEALEPLESLREAGK